MVEVHLHVLVTIYKHFLAAYIKEAYTATVRDDNLLLRSESRVMRILFKRTQITVQVTNCLKNWKNIEGEL